VEFNAISAHIIRGIFKYDGLKSNVCTGSFVSGDNYKKVFGENCNFMDKTVLFDCIIGNPPYNKGQKSAGKKGGGHYLWGDFVRKSILLLKDKTGYLNFVHPAAWRKPEGEKSKTKGLYDLMAK